MFQFIPISLAFLFCALLNFGVFLYLKGKSEVRGIRYLRLLFLSVSIWSASYGMELSCKDPGWMYHFTRLAYFGVATAPVFFFLFVTDYTHRFQFFYKNSLRGTLYIIPILAIILVISHPLQNWMHKNPFLIQLGSYYYQITPHGFFWYILMGYSYMLILIGLFLLIQMIPNVSRYYRRSVGIIFAGSLFPVIVNVLSLLGYNYSDRIDITPIAFTLTGLGFLAGTYYRPIFDIAPFAHSLLFEKMEDGIIVTDSTGKIVEVNQSVEQLFQQSREDILLRPLDHLFQQQNWWKKNIGQETSTIHWNGCWVECRISNLNRQTGEELGSILILRDITERKTNADTILLQNEQLKELNLQKSKYFSILAHDLRNPFSALMNFAQLMEKKYPQQNDEQRIKYIRIMQQAAQQSYELLENLLEWSRSQLGISPFRPESMNLQIILHSVVLQSRIMARNKGITLNLESEKDKSLMVDADEQMIRTVLRNLITNGIKFTPSGGEVKVIVQKEDTKVRIEVQDTGIGMSASTMEKLFQLHHAKSRKGTLGEKGTGLGLILCQELLGRHASTLEVESDEGRGTRFWFLLSLTRE